MDLRNKAAALLSKETGLKKKHIESILESPPSNRGDLAFPCFILSKKFGKSPGEAAKQLRDKIVVPKGFSKIEISGPYLNFYFDDSEFTKQVVENVRKGGDKFGSTNIGKGKKALIEHTSINPNASPHVGRARNAIIGNSLVKIYSFLNFRPEVHYFVNDVGKQIAMLVLAAGGKKPKFSELLNMYVKINKEVKRSPKREKEVFDILNKLESGDTKVRKRFRNVVEVCIKGQSKILGTLGINYDFFDYESKYLFDKSTNNILKKLKRSKKLFTDEDNRNVLNLKGYNIPMDNPVFVITRSDGTSLYGLRDLAYTEYKLKRSKENLLILGEDQRLYAKQMGAALDILGLPSPEVIHYSFVLLKTGKMSTRSGDVILLEDFMEKVYKKAEKEISVRTRGSLKNAGAIGNAAVIYSILKISPEKNVIFDINKAVSFEGDTGPYLQYTHARINSVLKKGKSKGKLDTNFLIDDDKNLLKIVNGFPQVVAQAYKNRKPNLVANYLLDLAKSFNSYYSKHRIVSENRGQSFHRLSICSAVKQTLANGLGLLGIEAIDEM